MRGSQPPRYVPVSELPNHPVGRRLTWQLPLPDSSGVNQFEVDAHTLKSFTNLGMLSTVRLETGVFREPQDPTRRPKLHDNELLQLPHPALTQRSHATLRLNLMSLREHLDQQGELHSPEAWASGVDFLAMRALRRAAFRNAVGHYPLAEGVMTVILAAGWGLSAEVEGVTDPKTLAMNAGVLLTVVAVLNTAFREYQDEPITLMPFGVDRIARIGAVSLRHRHLIRYNPALTKAA